MVFHVPLYMFHYLLLPVWCFHRSLYWSLNKSCMPVPCIFYFFILSLLANCMRIAIFSSLLIYVWFWIILLLIDEVYKPSSSKIQSISLIDHTAGFRSWFILLMVSCQVEQLMIVWNTRYMWWAMPSCLNSSPPSATYTVKWGNFGRWRIFGQYKTFILSNIFCHLKNNLVVNM